MSVLSIQSLKHFLLLTHTEGYIYIGWFFISKRPMTALARTMTFAWFVWFVSEPLAREARFAHLCRPHLVYFVCLICADCARLTRSRNPLRSHAAIRGILRKSLFFLWTPKFALKGILSMKITFSMIYKKGIYIFFWEDPNLIKLLNS